MPALYPKAPRLLWLAAWGLVAMGLGISTRAYADVPVSVGTQGSMERATQTLGASRNSSAASFGSPSNDDRRLFKLRWRIPLYTWGDEERPDGTFLFGAPGLDDIPGLSLFNERLDNITSYIPQLEFGEERKVVRLQAGVLSTGFGHGSLVHSYTNSPLGAERSFGLMGELNLAGIGGQALVSDITDLGNVFALRAYGRPLMWFMAPDATFQPNELDLDPRTELLGIWVSGFSFAIDGGAPLVEDGSQKRAVFASGWENQAAILDNRIIKTILYLDLNLMGGTTVADADGLRLGGGAHPGFELMFDFLGFRLDLDAEYNLGTDGYIPRYFDRLYALERNILFGSTSSPKASADAPASHGYSLRASGGFFEWFTLFLELQDQFPFDGARGSNSGRLSAGASAWFLFFGGHVAISQAGIGAYNAPDFMGPGFVFSAEARTALFFNVLHVVARHYRVHEATTNGDFRVLNGALIGMELNLDVF